MRLDAQGPTDGGGEAAVQILADLPFDPDHITHTVDAPERGSYYARLDDALRIPAGAGGWDGGEGRATFNTCYLPPGGEDWVVWQAASGTLDITRPPGFPQGGGETEEYLVASSSLPGVEGGRAELSLVATTVARVSDEFVSQGVEWTGR